MNCSEAREFIGADPDAESTELTAHLEACPDCLEYRAQMVILNAKIKRALDLNLNPFGSVDAKVVSILSRNAPAPHPAQMRTRGLAIAASLAAGLVMALALWLSRPTESLAAEIVTHVEGEPDSWARKAAVPTAELGAVLAKSNVKVGPGMAPVVYASSCWFRGHFVPHLVVSTTAGPVTVIILKYERINAQQTFNEAGFSGLLVPAPTGSVAILSRTPMALAAPAAEVVRALAAANN
jgi:hypothetical protein